MKPVMVIGVGSPFGADQLGWRVIDCLKEHQPLLPGSGINVKLVRSDRPGLALLDIIKDARLVVLVDAVLGGTAGIIREVGVNQIMLDNARFSSHSVGVADTLALGKKLGMLPDRLVVFGIEVGDDPMKYPDDVTIVYRVVDRISSFLDSWCSEL